MLMAVLPSTIITKVLLKIIARKSEIYYRNRIQIEHIIREIHLHKNYLPKRWLGSHHYNAYNQISRSRNTSQKIASISNAN